MPNLTAEQKTELLQSHCNRLIEQMDMDTLVAYANEMMAQSFDKNPGCGDTDMDMLFRDIYIAESEDLDSTEEFIAGVVGNDIAEEIIKNTEF